MTKPIYYITAALIIAAFFWGCKKNKQDVQPTNVSTWTYSGIKFIGNNREFIDNTLESNYQDPGYLNPDRLLIFFGTTPVSSGVYTITDQAPPQGMCNVWYITKDSHSYIDGINGSVIVTITGNEVTATFDDIPMGTITNDMSGHPVTNIFGRLSGKVIGNKITQ